jgi:hypothetical protein
LTEIVRACATSGVDTLFVEWEDRFPWSTDERMRGPQGYSEEVINGIGSLCRSYSVGLVPVLGGGGLPGAVFRVPGYGTVAGFTRSEQSIENHASAAVRLSLELISDIAASAGIASGVALWVPLLEDAVLERYELRYLTPLIEEIGRQGSMVWLLCEPEQERLLRHRGGMMRHLETGNLRFLVNRHPDSRRYTPDGGHAGSVVLPVTRDGHVGRLTRPIESFLPQALEELGCALDADHAEARLLEQCSRELNRHMDQMEAVTARLSDMAARFAEVSVQLARDSALRHAGWAWLEEERQRFDALLREVEEAKSALHELLEQALLPGTAASYFAERVAPTVDEGRVALLRLERLLL